MGAAIVWTGGKAELSRLVGQSFKSMVFEERNSPGCQFVGMNFVSSRASSNVQEKLLLVN